MQPECVVDEPQSQTPLNNNIRELFNLMNFLDPQNWDDLPGLEAKFETLDESLLSELHEMLKPYFLRRTKAMVLSLPPKVLRCGCELRAPY